MSGREQTTTDLSISFTVEEVVVLAAALGHDPARVGVSLPAEWTRRERQVALGVANGSLRSRRVIVDQADGPAMSYPVAALFDIVCAPAVRVELHRDADPAIRFLTQPDATVRLAHRAGIYQFTPFATADLMRWVAADAGVTTQPAGDGGVVELNAHSYLAARALLRGPEPTVGKSRLVDAGLPDVLVEVLARPAGTRSLAVRRRSGLMTVGGEVAWVDAGDAGLWQLPTFDQPVAGAGDASYAGDGSVRIEPISAEALLATIAGFLTDET